MSKKKVRKREIKFITEKSKTKSVYFYTKKIRFLQTKQPYYRKQNALYKYCMSTVVTVETLTSILYKDFGMKKSKLKIIARCVIPIIANFAEMKICVFNENATISYSYKRYSKQMSFMCGE